MATPTLPLPKDVNIDYGSSRKKTAKVLKAQFGNGYAQRAGDGLNSVSSEYTVSFTNLTYAEAKQIDAFLEERAGYQAFYYRPPLSDEVPKLWTCENWTLTHVDGLLYSISGSFKQEFTP